jgi:hypothetical protein
LVVFPNILTTKVFSIFFDLFEVSGRHLIITSCYQSQSIITNSTKTPHCYQFHQLHHCLKPFANIREHFASGGNLVVRDGFEIDTDCGDKGDEANSLHKKHPYWGSGA